MVRNFWRLSASGKCLDLLGMRNYFVLQIQVKGGLSSQS